MDEIISKLDMILNNRIDIFFENLKKMCNDKKLYYPDIVKTYFNKEVIDENNDLERKKVEEVYIDGENYYIDDNGNVYIMEKNNIGILFGHMDGEEIIPNT
tara:strand:+ start:145 stop:447 length:303 start_codon:yes stop_codon:yes gene_type:complete